MSHDLWSHNFSADFTLVNSLFGAANDDFDKYFCFEYGIWFSTRGNASLSAGRGFGKDAVIFGVDNSSSAHTNNGKKDILIFGILSSSIQTICNYKKRRSRLLNYKINFTWLYITMETTVFLFVNGVKICQFKANDSEINTSPMCLGNIWKYFPVENMKNLYGHVHDFSVDYDNVNGDDILDIHKYLMKTHDIN